MPFLTFWELTDPNKVDGYGWNALHAACDASSSDADTSDMVNLLIERYLFAFKCTQ